MRKQAMPGQDGQSADPLIEPLTRRERDILMLLARRLSAPEIAQELTLAISTVKWYIQQLYGKLGVNGRRSAIVRATELGLLEPLTPGSAHGPAAPAHPKHNLPAPGTRFFGREAEIAELKAQFAENRLLTLVGAGGI